MVEIVVQPNYPGPSILEIEPVLPQTEGVVEIRWGNTKAEQMAIARHPDRGFRLIVEDPSTMERTATALGLRFVLDLSLTESGKLALISRKSYNWRAFSEGIGTGVTRSLITKLSADYVRKGKQPKLAIIAAECLLDGINPSDADVLLRLAAMRSQ